MKRRRLGQHYLVDQSVIDKIIKLARIKPGERILEIGTGKGALTKQLARLGSTFIGYEVDRENFDQALKAVEGTKAQMHFGDAFKQRPEFDVLVGSLPYSESATFVEWLSSMEFDRAVVLLQEDFVKKIMVPPGDRDYRGISVLAQIAFGIVMLDKVDRRSFSPQPRVNSGIVSFEPKRRITQEERANIMRLFSMRRRQIDTALAELGMKWVGSHGKRRVYSLLPEEVHEICRPPGLQ